VDAERQATAIADQVLALVGVGCTNRRIAEALFISPKAASVHVTPILDTLGRSSRVEAALFAARAGIGGDAGGSGPRAG
jgi:DNA-binding NarL/FixJ family response regulator